MDGSRRTRRGENGESDDKKKRPPFLKKRTAQIFSVLLVSVLAAVLNEGFHNKNVMSFTP
jgi:hypothetical protein